MAVRLSPRDQQMLAGDHGRAAKLAMAIIARMAPVYGADELMDVSGAHIDGSIYQGDASLEFAETLAALGGRVVIPTTMNIGSLDELHWREWGGIAPEWADKSHRIMQAYLKMGCTPTWTCAPYQAGVRPALGEDVVWAESNAIVFANSVLGARTNRYGDYIDICAGLTGRAPRSGLHLPENRRGQLLLQLEGVPQALLRDDSLYPVLGYLVGNLAGERIPVIAGLPEETTEDQLKALGAAAASSGAIAMFHAVGITPEAPTLEAAFGGAPPPQTHCIGMEALRQARAQLSTVAGDRLDLVILGSPHFSLPEFRRLAPRLAGKRRDPRVQFIVTTSRFVLGELEREGLRPTLDAFGVRLMTDTCILNFPTVQHDAQVTVCMTNSGKYAHYIPGQIGKQVIYGSTADCVASAISGRVVRDDALWNA